MKTAQKMTAIALGLALAGLGSVVPASAGGSVTVMATPQEERDAIDAAALEARNAALAAADSKAKGYIDMSQRLLSTTSSAAKKAEETYQASKTLANFRTLAQARSNYSQAKVVAAAIRVAADKQKAVEKKSANLIYPVTMRPANLWFAYKSNKLETNPCVVTYMGHLEALTAEQIDTLETTPMESGYQWEAAVSALRTGLVGPFATAVRAEVEREKARLAYAKNRTAYNLSQLNLRKSEYAQAVYDRDTAATRLRSAFASVQANLPVTSEAALTGAQTTYDTAIKPYKDAFLVCLDPTLKPPA